MDRRWIVVAAGVVAAALIAWFLIGRSRQGDTVELLGDSITVVSDQVLRDGLRDYTLNVQAMSGLRTDQLQGAAEQAAASHPKQVIINLGTNDVLQGKGLDQVTASLEKMITTFSEADCIHVVTLNTHMVTSAGPKEAELQSANDAIDELIRGHDNVGKIDWNRIVEESDDGTGRETVTVDSIHPNSKGQLLLTKAYADALRSCGKPFMASDQPDSEHAHTTEVTRTGAAR